MRFEGVIRLIRTSVIDEISPTMKTSASLWP